MWLNMGTHTILGIKLHNKQLQRLHCMVTACTLGHPKLYSCFWSPPASIFGYVATILAIIGIVHALLYSMLIAKHMASVYC